MNIYETWRDRKEDILDCVDIELLLMSLGFKAVQVKANEWRAPCAVHGGDGPTSFSLRTDTKRWRCWSRQCEQDDNGKSNNDLVALVMRTQRVPFAEAVQFLADLAGVPLHGHNR